jgi:hypothetical protein
VHRKTRCGPNCTNNEEDLTLVLSSAVVRTAPVSSVSRAALPPPFSLCFCFSSFLNRKKFVYFCFSSSERKKKVCLVLLLVVSEAEQKKICLFLLLIISEHEKVCLFLLLIISEQKKSFFFASIHF